MKKLLVIVAVFLVLLGALVLAAWHFGPAIAYRTIGKVLGGTVEVNATRIAYQDGTIVFTLAGIRLKGKVEGTIENCELRLLPRRGVYIRTITLSRFELSAQKQEGKVIFYPIPVEHAIIRDGIFRYGGQKFVIREITVSNFNTGKQLEFTIDGSVEGFGRIRTHGEGIFGEKHSDIKGEYRIFQLDIGRVLKDYQGLTDSEGLFSFKDGTLVLDGEVWSPYFSIWEKFLTTRLGESHGRAHIRLTLAGEMSEVTLTGITFEAAPLTLKVKSRLRTVLSVELTMGFFSIPHLLKYVDMSQLADGDWGPLSYVTDGEVSIKRLVYRENAPFAAAIVMRDATAGKGSFIFADVNGSLEVEGQMVTLSGFSGRFHDSRLQDVAGHVPLTRNRDVEVAGAYRVSLGDLETFLRTSLVTHLSGVTTGTFGVQGRPDQAFAFRGGGTLEEGRFVWEAAPLSAAGKYVFSNDSLTFEELNIKGDGTSLTAHGTIEKGGTSLSIAGTVESRHVASFLPKGLTVKGPAGVTGDLSFGDRGFSGLGRIDLTPLLWEIPGIIRKPAGLKNRVRVSMDAAYRGEVTVHDLDVTLGTVKAQATGRADPTGITEARIGLDAPGVEQLSGLFPDPGLQILGDLKVHVDVRDLPFSLTKLPSLKGRLSFHRGSVAFPSMVNPFTDLDLEATFDDDRFTADVSGVKAGKTGLERGHVEVTGRETPSFSLTMDLSSLDPHDFRQTLSRPFAIPSIGSNTLLGRTTGTFLIKARRFVFADSEGGDLSLSGTLKDGMVAIRHADLTMGTGKAVMEGTADLSGTPKIDLAVDFHDVTAEDTLGLLGTDTDLIEGKGAVSARLNFTGRTGNDLRKSAAGAVAFDSRNGVIKKWNLLAKILAVSNIYDLVQGKVDLRKKGLTYRKMSGTFTGNKGVFHTGDFLVDSPSMLITGRGSVNVPEGEVDGKMLVSPLVTIDKILNWIPLVKWIFREKKEGFVFFVYDVKGPMEDPKITSSYVESVARRLLNIFLNTMRLPKDVLDLLPREEHRGQ